MIIFCADHGGFKLKEELKSYIKSLELELRDYGAFDFDAEDDYPDYAKPASKAVAKIKNSFGIFVCGSGIGMTMVANKQKGVRAAVAYSLEHAALARKDENANVLCLGARLTNFETAKRIVDTFLSTQFEGGRHFRRISKFK